MKPSMTSDTLIEIKSLAIARSLSGSISTEFGVRFRAAFDLNFGHIFASH
jgi:hypothetical protein